MTGSKGTAIWDGTNLPYCEYIAPSEEKLFVNQFTKQEAAAEWNGREGHPGCLDEMFLALEQGRAAETDCSDNVRSMAMVFGAIESAKLGKRIELAGWY